MMPDTLSTDCSRRHFIRLVGGGSLAVVASLSGGCSARFPDVAVAPWAGPDPDSELRRWALGYAILAPSSHNRQPWLVDLSEPEAITLYVDRQRLLPETDPWFRQILVSQGTFIEALVIALQERGLAARVELFPQGAFAAREVDDRPVARIAWSAKAPAPAKDPLFAQLLRRHTAKQPYDTAKPVPAELLTVLAAAPASDEGLRFGASVEPALRDRLRELSQQAAAVELGTERTMLESLRLLRVGPEEIAAQRDGIALNEAMPRLLAALGLFDRTRMPAPGSMAARSALQRFAQLNASAMGWVWLATPVVAGRTRQAEIAAGRAYLRLQLTATALGLQMHPMSQAPQEFAEMKPHYDALHRLLLGQAADEAVVQMLCRIGWCAEQPHTPRRGVDAVIRA